MLRKSPRQYAQERGSHKASDGDETHAAAPMQIAAWLAISQHLASTFGRKGSIGLSLA